MSKKKLTNRKIEELEALYDSDDFRFSQERNDFLLPQIFDFVKEKRINIRPEYQRRLLWDHTRKSKFIESLLMNIPIPPIFLYENDLSRYENDLSRYEVMDGQQRLNAIVEFYENRFSLNKLDQWSSLNGLKYGDCPPRIQRGFDRRRLPVTILLTDSARDEKQAQNIKQFVFERLNTGGQRLNEQELRNCLYSGPFNNLIIELAGEPLFKEIWEIEIPCIDSNLVENRYYNRMLDCEIVLRFFAFRRKSKITGSIRKILDNCMIEYLNIDSERIQFLKERFLACLNLAHKIFDQDAFRIRGDSSGNKLSISMFDGVMVALDRLYEQHKKQSLIDSSKDIKQTIAERLKDEEFHALMVGRSNTARTIKDKIQEIENIFRRYI